MSRDLRDAHPAFKLDMRPPISSNFAIHEAVHDGRNQELGQDLLSTDRRPCSSRDGLLPENLRGYGALRSASVIAAVLGE